MAVGISKTAIQSAEITGHTNLHRVVHRLGVVAGVVDSRSTDVRAERIRRVAACNVQPGSRIAVDGLAVHRGLGHVVGAQCYGSAVSRGDRLSWLIRIFGGIEWRQLVPLAPKGQMNPQAAYIAYLHHHVTGQLPLNGQVVLLHVGPDCMGWDGNYAQRETQPGAARVLVSDVVVLVGSLHHRRRSLQELGVALVAV